jgi:hypothetical protein
MLWLDDVAPRFASSYGLVPALVAHHHAGALVDPAREAGDA